MSNNYVPGKIDKFKDRHGNVWYPETTTEGVWHGETTLDNVIDEINTDLSELIKREEQVSCASNSSGDLLLNQISKKDGSKFDGHNVLAIVNHSTSPSNALLLRKNYNAIRVLDADKLTALANTNLFVDIIYSDKIKEI